jgi:acid phosphatase family membrane protein YuiD
MQQIIIEIITNKLLVLPILVLVITQLLKFFPSLIKKKFDWKYLWATGGMPSAHSSTAISFATVSAIVFGFNSSFFALSVFLSALIIRDALGVRKAAAEQAKVLNKITNNKYNLDEKIGHNPAEVAVGAIVGLVLTSVILYFWK